MMSVPAWAGSPSSIRRSASAEAVFTKATASVAFANCSEAFSTSCLKYGAATAAKAEAAAGSPSCSTACAFVSVALPSAERRPPLRRSVAICR